MRCPTLAELPPPPSGKTGWPWTEESPQLSDRIPDGSEWPKISIVTPNYNYGQFIEETIRSVLLQGYPNLEYIVIDAASTDNSVEIIKKYEKWITYWESQSDSGQSNAINKGISKATGQWVNWLNSDDFLLPDELKIQDKILNFIFPNDYELTSLYKQSLGFVYPSLYEGFGIPPLEAMTCGTPVIASDTSSIPEVVGDAGLLFDPQSTDELVDKLQFILDNPLGRDRLIDLGHLRAKKFSWEKTANQTLEIYRSVTI